MKPFLVVLAIFVPGYIICWFAVSPLVSLIFVGTVLWIDFVFYLLFR